MAGPLDGISIIDLTTVLMGPFATQMMGDLGANIIKVESYQGDISRQIAPYRNKGMGHMFMNVNRNKRSIAIDLKQPKGRDTLLKLVKHADVLIYNIRPYSMDQLKLTYEDILKINPSIIYVGAFGYSQRGPYASKPAYEDLIQGAAGIPYLFQKQGSEEPCYVPINLVDRYVGQHIVSNVCAALFYRERTGKGQRIDIPMFESLLTIVMGEHLSGMAFDPPIAELGYERILDPYRKPFQTKDGHVCILIYNDKQWLNFCKTINKPELLEDIRFNSVSSRSKNYKTINFILSKIFKKYTTNEWLELLEPFDIPIQKLNNLLDILEDKHLKKVNYFQTYQHPTEGKIRTTASPSEWSVSQPSYRHHAPQLGEHTREILLEAGLNNTDIDFLLSEKAVFESEK